MIEIRWGSACGPHLDAVAVAISSFCPLWTKVDFLTKNKKTEGVRRPKLVKIVTNHQSAEKSKSPWSIDKINENDKNCDLDHGNAGTYRNWVLVIGESDKKKYQFLLTNWCALSASPRSDRLPASDPYAKSDSAVDFSKKPTQEFWEMMGASSSVRWWSLWLLRFLEILLNVSV